MLIIATFYEFLWNKQFVGVNTSNTNTEDLFFSKSEIEIIFIDNFQKFILIVKNNTSSKDFTKTESDNQVTYELMVIKNGKMSQISAQSAFPELER